MRRESVVKVTHEVHGVSTLHNRFYTSFRSAPGVQAVNPLPVIGETGRPSFVETLKVGGQLPPNGVAPTRRVHTQPGNWTLERIYQRVVRGEDGCHVWVGPKNQAGYGQVSVWEPARGRNVCWKVHRLAYVLAVGPIPVGLTLDHTCQRRDCVNPLHLEPVPLRENLRRGNGFGARNARKTHCPAGHPYDAENTYVSRAGKRNCRACARVRQETSSRKGAA